MRRIVVGAFISLDGVMQAPGGPEEDPSHGFRYGGWLPPHWDDVTGAAMGEAFSAPYDLLLGRKTYDIFAAHWPYVDTDPSSKGFDALNADIAREFNAITKYVATHRPESLTWQNSQALGTDVVSRLRQLKEQDGPRLLTQGSTELVHLLFANNLVDELRLLIFPVVLGSGKRLFDSGSLPRSLKLTQSVTSPSGAIIASYERAGDVKTGSFVAPNPSQAELERRRNWT
jgi:dihydrofolate reductase